MDKNLKYLEKKVLLLNESLDKAEEIFTDSEEKVLQDIPYNTIAILYLSFFLNIFFFDNLYFESPKIGCP